MLKTIFLTCLLVAAFSWSIQKKEENQLFYSQSQNLKFINYTSICTTQAQINTFIKAANDATKTYGQDFEKNMDYIANVMNTFEGKQNIRNFVLIQQKVDTRYSYSLVSRRGFCYSTLAGINTAHPTWSYMFITFSNPPSLTYKYIAYAGKGSQITPQIEGFIFRIISETEPEIRCDCNAAGDIRTKIQTSLSEVDWSVVCDDSYDLNAYIAPLSGQWIYAQPSRCHYLIFGT